MVQFTAQIAPSYKLNAVPNKDAGNQRRIANQILRNYLTSTLFTASEGVFF